jgi:coenzyme PQQ synthesis protein D (PqqD)
MARRNPSVEEAPLQDELMLFEPSTAKFFVLNSTMAYVWRNWDDHPDAEALAAGIERDFEGADRDAVRSDVQAAVADLKNLGLLVD